MRNISSLSELRGSLKGLKTKQDLNKTQNVQELLVLTRVCLASSGLHLGLSGLPQLSGLRMDSCSPPSSRQEGFVSRRGHSDATDEEPEGENLPNAPHRRLREGEGERHTRKVKPGRCFLPSAAKTRATSELSRGGKTPLSCPCRGPRLSHVMLNY